MDDPTARVGRDPRPRAPGRTSTLTVVAVVVGALGVELAVLAAAGAVLIHRAISEIDLDLDLGDLGALGDGVLRLRHWDLEGRDVATGAPVWERELPGTVSGDDLVVTDDAGTVHALDPTTGADRWAQPLGSGAGGPAVSEGLVVVVTDTGDVVGLEALTGTEQWRSPVGAAAWTPAVSGGTVLVAAGGGAVALDAATGAPKWDRVVPRALRPAIGAGPVVGIVAFDADGVTTSTVFVDAESGQEAWRTPSGALSSFAYDAATSTLFEYGEWRALVARDATTGAVRWQAEAPDGNLLVARGVVYLATDAGVLTFATADGAPGPTVPVAGAPDLVALADGLLVVAR